MHTYFGLEVVRGQFVRLADIEALPFVDFWRVSTTGTTFLHDPETAISLVYLHDWERFCRLFIQTGQHRFNAGTDRRNLIDVLAELSPLGPEDEFPEDIDSTLLPPKEIDL